MGLLLGWLVYLAAFLAGSLLAWLVIAVAVVRVSEDEARE